MTTMFFVLLALLAVIGVTATVTAILRDGYRRTPEQRPVRWYQCTDALRTRPTGSR